MTMADERTGYKHDASDKKLDKSAEAAETQETAAASHEHEGHHDPDKIRKHDDTGKDRMFEGREQHDEADMKSEKNRLAKDQAKHHHAVEGEDAVTESNMHVKRKD
jgi:hypothetical protein